MLNLHPPFRRARPGDTDMIRALLGERSGAAPGEAVVAEEDGEVTAVLDGRPDGGAWRVEALAVFHERVAELGPRVLRIADALAAEDGLGSVVLDPASLDPQMRALLEEEGFRPADGGAGLMERPVVPQG
ncbi:hypothetical protein [Enterovirga aerilata]|uniref:N-acetyltransferase domain-containing protein n=1 Tax=Enterovirga aerilata TaxID=2730920 RepID=A0A849I7X1_9HYPH|nr:hypothetical protein [Enterovirga sp. DB1703]NNM72107.1 hypothetical protein [Enterovirga sp. DB1703]